MQPARTVNGVDVGRLADTVQAIADQPRIADFRFRVSNRWISGGHNRTTIVGYYGAGRELDHPRPFEYDEDEPPELLGEDLGANPVEYALTALAGCLTSTLVYHAAARGVRIDVIESELEGEIDLHGFLGLDETVRNGFSGIRVSFRIQADATPAQLQELVELAQQRSPVFDIVTHPVPVQVRLLPD